MRDDLDASLVRDGATALSVNANYILSAAKTGNLIQSGVNGVWTAGATFGGGTITLDQVSIGGGGVARIVLEKPHRCVAAVQPFLTPRQRLAVDRALGRDWGFGLTI